MTDTNQLPPLPTLQPGDSHMESLIESAIQGHADTRDAMRWLVRQLVPATQPAEVTLPHLWPVIRWLKNGCDVADAITELELYERHIEKARAILALRPVQVPMTREQAMAIVQSNPDTMTAIRTTEAHHFGITAQAQKGKP